MILEIGNNLQTYYFHAEKVWLDENWTQITVSFGFQTLISLLFLSRFILFWFKQSKYIWFSQLVWLITWLMIFAYNGVTTKMYYGSFWGKNESSCMDCMYFDTFLYASDALFIILSFYLFFSPIKQSLILIFAFVKK
jgi:hypothetical protein